ncbi:MAG: rRNA ((527)-N(7))-methyltransferase RsmG [Naasia sp.]|uniref:16S rRNA (guanine(527)-N(7))-methyltransferase RsmG n=1 Tax=Naasia sp. TaxID=2546198 RepID=UPI002639E872|nr:16S rRNA (guanine(527)-N(7))-methyltransferase RsmG [Naasia sp.]MCU1570276.1 rRNA ((527)-N(7))-methyltransferase RsmG [Naasia sp.]
MTVPRETEHEPAIAAQLFGNRIDLARAYTGDLAERGEELGLIGPLELPRLWTRHVLNSVLLAPLMAGRVGDVGSGAGLPGLVLAIARPDVEFVLIEPMERRVRWLQEQVNRLSLANVTVVNTRAEEAPYPRQLDQVTARAVGALSKLIPLTARLVRPDGELLLLKGANVAVEAEKATRAIARGKLTDVRVEELGVGMATEVTRVFRARVQ